MKKIFLVDFWSIGTDYSVRLVSELNKYRDVDVYFLTKTSLDKYLDNILLVNNVNVKNVFVGHERRYLKKLDTIIWNIVNYVILLRIILDDKPSTVHFVRTGVEIELVFMKIFSGYFKGINFVKTLHDVTPHRSILPKIIQKYIYKICLKTYNKVIVHTLSNNKVAKELYDLETIVIPHGVYITNNESIDHEQSKTILFIGSLRRDKNLDIVISAFQKSKIKNKYKLVIRGKYPNGEHVYRNDIENLIKYDITNIDYETGYIDGDEFDRYISSSSYLVLPYADFNSQSGVISKALTFKCPIICSKTLSFTEVLKDNAIYIDLKVESLANTFDEIYNKGYLIGQLSDKMKNLVKEYSWENISYVYKDIY